MKLSKLLMNKFFWKQYQLMASINIYQASGIIIGNILNYARDVNNRKTLKLT